MVGLKKIVEKRYRDTREVIIAAVLAGVGDDGLDDNKKNYF